jgi:small subunit ribosomal protein S9
MTVLKELKLKVPQVFTYGTGKRKSSIAKVWLFEGKGKVSVNNLECENYFGSKLDAVEILKPLEILSIADKYDVKASVLGGGKAGQVDSVILGISRALLELNSTFRDKLKAEGFLTRDPRVKERKKYGLRKARKAPQYRKR